MEVTHMAKLPPMSPEPARILGIDPGLQVAGYAVLESTRDGPKVLDAGSFAPRRTTTRTWPSA